MKKPSIDQRLIDARPDSHIGNQAFVERTMNAIKTHSTNETFAEVLRKTNVTKKETFTMKLKQLQVRFKQLPSYAVALIILASVSTVGATAYAAYKWIYPSVSITNIQSKNDDNKRQYTVDSQCGEFYSGKELKYELAQDSGLTDADVKKVFENTCAYNALGSFIDSRWKSDNDEESVKKKKVGDQVTIYDHSNIFSGSTNANPIFGLSIGKVVSLNKSQVTIELPVYSIENMPTSPNDEPFQYYPKGKIVSRTLPLAGGIEVWADGKTLTLEDVKIGDTIHVVTRTQNKVQYYEDIKQNALGEQITFDTVGIIKTTIDPRYVASSGSQIGDPTITNVIASLSTCNNNEPYLCVFAPSQVLGPVYSTIDEEQRTVNLKYLRTDIDFQDQSKLFALDGRVVKIEGTKITLETRGHKTLFTVELPYDAVKAYNQARPAKTDRDKSMALKLEVGDLVQTLYSQAENENRLQIKPGDILSISVLQQIQPDGSLEKY